MITKVAVALDILELKKSSKKELKCYMKEQMIEAIKKEIIKTNIKLHIDIDEHRIKAGYIFVYTNFELNLEVEKNENS